MQHFVLKQDLLVEKEEQKVLMDSPYVCSSYTITFILSDKQAPGFLNLRGQQEGRQHTIWPIVLNNVLLIH